ncbi:MAG TPA: RES family NAD+ phosphorylase [Solirubrobacteraceae bacterium]
MALDVEPTTTGGRWYRHTPAGADPLARPSPPDDNRWQRGHVIDALYLCDTEDCVWAEWYRHLAERGVPPHTALPRDLWTYKITAVTLADLRTTSGLARVGLTHPAPGRRDWPAFQAVGEQLYRDGFTGLIAPSAAPPQNLVLCVFLADQRLPDVATPRHPPRRVRLPPPPPTRMRT